MTETVVFTQEELEARCKLWQERLRIRDWRVHLSLVSWRDMEEGQTGGCLTEQLARVATVRVLRPEDFKQDNSPEPFDMEVVLVHELLHIVLCACEPDDDTIEHRCLEQGIESIAEALVKAYRQQEAA